MSQFVPNDDTTATIDIRSYLILFWNWIWLILLIGVVTGAAAFIVSTRTVPVYQTTTRLLISDPPTQRSLDYSAMVSTQSMTRTYAQMIVDGPVLQGVIDRLNLSILPQALAGKIRVNVVENTQLLEVVVESTDPQQAADIANTLGQVFAERIRELQSQRYGATQAGLAKQISDMEQQINLTTQALAKETDAAQKLQLESRMTEYRRLYSNLVTNFEQVRLSEAQTGTNVVVSRPAITPTNPVRPRTSQNTLMGFLAGMSLATMVVFVLELLDDTLKNPDEIRKKFGLSILGMIANHETIDNKPISQSQPRSPVAEAFRSMRTNITFASVDTPLRRILITSATPQDGKTTISTNLAVVLAQGERKAVLIDADLRRPQVHRRFGLLNRSGLSGLFVSPLDAIPSVIQSVDIPGLAIITSGSLPPNPSELLTSHKMIQILDQLNESYDLLLIDTPPVLSVTDSVALAARMDGVILVARPGKTRLRDFKQTIEQLKGVGANVLGVVLNDVDTGSRKYGYYYGGYYSKSSHYYSNDQENTQKKRKRLPRATNTPA
jgi:succinoglycan biosynthesis transport protein ExoP